MSLKSPFTTKVERGAYSAIVFIDGDLVVAENNVGTVISEQAKSDYVSNVIQAAADKVTKGKIFVKNVGEDYVVKSGVTFPVGLSFVSDGAKLDLTNLDTTFLSIGNDLEYIRRKLTEVSGFYLLGDFDKLNTLFLKASGVDRGLVVKDIFYTLVNNLIDVRGVCYSARISDIAGGYAKGTVIKITALDADGWAPNALTISNFEHSNGAACLNIGKGIEILASDAYTPEGIAISNCWLEKLHTGIFTEGKRIKIYGSLITGKTYGIHIHDQGVNTNCGEDTQVTNNTITTSVSTTHGIEVAGCPYKTHIISENTFDNIYGTAINSAVRNTINISGNIFNFDAANSVGIGGTIKTDNSGVEDNSFIGSTGAPIGTGISARLEDYIVANNQFIGLVYWLNNSNIANNKIHGNIIRGVTNSAPTVGSGNTIKHNKGYVTENSGSSTGTGAQQTIAHGLGGTPNLVMLGDKEQNANPYQSAAADATNIYITAGNGLDYWWNVEII